MAITWINDVTITGKFIQEHLNQLTIATEVIIFTGKKMDKEVKTTELSWKQIT
jgi:hypothetical protein